MRLFERALPFAVGLLVVMIWGVSFICSKRIVKAGMGPHEVYFLRSLISYLCLISISNKTFRTGSWKDELHLALLGIFGGSLYYILENLSLIYSYASNVSLIVSESPLITMFLAVLAYKFKCNKQMTLGAICALIGMVLLVFNGDFAYNIRWIGDFLALAASMCWALYSLLIKRVSGKYDVLFITRKVFFYGMVTVLPLFYFKPFVYSLDKLFSFEVLPNLLYLAIISSFACFVGWNYVVSKLGAVRAANIVYLNPIFTCIAASFMLKEPLSIYSVIGAFFIILGVFLTEKGFGKANS